MLTLPQVSGPTEHALRALLDRELASSRIPDYLGWVCLNLSTAASARSDLEAHLEQATKSTPEQAAATVDGLMALGLLTGNAQPTSEGQAELMSTRQRVKATTDKLTAGLSEADLAIAIGVLDHVRGRAEAILKS
jgi:uncharacterized pyridoxal phosphate-containing UPF0001 family protein